MRLGRLALVAVAVLTAAAAGTVLAVAVSAATGGTVSWFPPVEHDPLWWTAGSTAAVAVAGLLVWWGQRRYDVGLRELVPAVQRPEEWVVDRPTEVGRIVAAVSGGGTAGVTIAIHGAAGFGKTTIARMVQADPRVLRRFGRRVYWVTVGRDVGRQSLTGLVNDLITRLDPDRPVTFINPQAAAKHLAAILAGGPRRLLVVDDVWTQAQLDAFPVAGGCTRLVTTRTASLIGGTGFAVPVGRMTEREADAVLRGKSGLPELQPALAAQLAVETGRWPLLLRLINKILVDRTRLQTDITAAAEELLGMLRQGQALELDRLSGATAQLDGGGDPGERAGSARATIEASTGLLDPVQRARFAELAVFAGNETIPATLAAALWQDTGRLESNADVTLLVRLEDLALLTLTPSPDGGTIKLHSVIRDLLREELGEPRLRQLHQSLLECAAVGLPAARSGTGEGTITAWWELPKRARYLRDHLIEHLIAAQDPQAAELLATDLRWIAVRLEQSGPAAPYGDLSLIETPRARRLQRVLGQSVHLLAVTDPSYSQADILYSRVSHDPDWGPQARALQAASTHPALADRLPLPDLPHPALRRTLTGHDYLVCAVAIAPDGSWLVTADGGGIVLMWEAATGRQRAAVTSHSWVHAVAIAPDGSWLVTGDHDGTVRIWDAATGEQRAVRAGHHAPVSAVAIAPDGSWLASAGLDGTVRIWDAATGEQRAALTGHQDWVRSVAITPDGSWLATGTDSIGLDTASDGAVRIWDAATGQERAALTGHHGAVNAVAIAPDGTWLASGGDRTVRIWDATGTQSPALTGHQDWVNAVAIAPDGTWLATGGRTVRIWDAATGRERAVLTGHYGGVAAVAIAPDGTWLASGGGDGIVLMWDAVTGRQRTAASTGYAYNVDAVAIAPDGTWLAAGSTDNTVRIWDATGTQTAALTGHQEWVNAVAIAPDGSWLASGDGDGTVRIWDAATGRQRAALTGHACVNAVAIAPDGSWLATADSYGTMRIWEQATGHARAIMRVDGALSDCKWSPSGKSIAAAGSAGWYSFTFTP